MLSDLYRVRDQCSSSKLESAEPKHLEWRMKEDPIELVQLFKRPISIRCARLDLVAQAILSLHFVRTYAASFFDQIYTDDHPQVKSNECSLDIVLSIYIGRHFVSQIRLPTYCNRYDI